MAKGKGKGHGKGKKKDNSEGNCCGCICCCLLLPPILFMIGVCFLITENSRVENIEQYNERAKKWVEEGLETFKGADFSVDGQKLEMDTTTSGKFYPVSDSCDKEGDPEEKCVYTEALYYKTIIPISSDGSTPVDVMSDGEIIASKTFNNQYTEIYTPSDLSCNEEKSKCFSKCHNKGGEWNSFTERCTVTYYLNSVCYRVAKANDKYMLDIPPIWTLSGNDAGCDYSNDYQPAIYGTNQVSSISVSVRYYQDSYISASEMTGGCSSSSASSTSCFGMSRKEQDKLGYGLAGVGLFLFVVEIGLLVFMCMCCKETISTLFGKKKKSLLKADGTAIPTVQPTYMPTAQPVQPNYMPPYTPSQNYMPTAQPVQPNYMPTAQPAQPIQPNYMHAQPGYAPYNPQQQY